jgi:hypothetical protein
LRGYFDAAAQSQIDKPRLQILCLFLASTLICPQGNSFVGIRDIIGEGVWDFGPQRGWKFRKFPEQKESFLHREAVSASLETFELRAVGVLAETSEVRPARLDEIFDSLKQYIFLGNGTEPIECGGG